MPTESDTTTWAECPPGTLNAAAMQIRRRTRIRAAVTWLAAAAGVLLAVWLAWPTKRPGSPASVDYLYGGIACSEVVSQLKEYAAGRLDAATTARMAEHLRLCAKCRRVQSQISGQAATSRGTGAIAWQARSYAE